MKRIQTATPVVYPRRQPTALWRAAVLLGVVAVGGGGCKSSSLSQYIAPRIEGRTVDARTRQPLAGVTVHRVVPGEEAAPGDTLKGGQSMEQSPDVRTKGDGTFALASERDLELFQRSGWYSVTLRFQHVGYASFTTNFTPAQATQTAGGEPLVKAGDIPLVPLSR